MWGNLWFFSGFFDFHFCHLLPSSLLIPSPSSLHLSALAHPLPFRLHSLKLPFFSPLLLLPLLPSSSLLSPSFFLTMNSEPFPDYPPVNGSPAESDSSSSSGANVANGGHQSQSPAKDHRAAAMAARKAVKVAEESAGNGGDGAVNGREKTTSDLGSCKPFWEIFQDFCCFLLSFSHTLILLGSLCFLLGIFAILLGPSLVFVFFCFLFLVSFPFFPFSR